MKRVPLLALTFGIAAASFADSAVLVGIDTYPFLPGAKLSACENDVDLMRGILSRRGFSSFVTMKSNDASKENILAAMDRAIRKAMPGERVVYYHSGHGSQAQDGKSTLLTASSKGNFEGDITSEELAARVEEARKKQVNFTLIIDACHSEGVASKSSRPITAGMERKVYIRPGAEFKLADDNFIGERGARVVRRNPVATQTPQTNLEAIVGFGMVNQYVSSRADEVSWATEFPEGKHSVFTYYLSKAMGVDWAQTTVEVNKSVMRWSQDEQHPVFVGVGGQLFTKGLVSEKSVVERVNVPDFGSLLALDRVDRDVLSLQATVSDPEVQREVPFSPETPIRTMGHPKGGVQVRLEVSAKRSGWLFVFDRDMGNALQLMGETSAVRTGPELLKFARISAGQVKSFPEDRESAYEFDLAGPEHIKAILVTDEALATRIAEMLVAAKILEGVTMTDLVSQSKLGIEKADASRFATDDLRFNIVKN